MDVILVGSSMPLLPIDESTNASLASRRTLRKHSQINEKTSSEFTGGFSTIDSLD